MSTKREKEIQAMTNEELIGYYSQHVVRLVHAENSRRGVSKTLHAEENYFVDEMCLRFGLNREKLITLLNK